jgi:hypothetical protein
VKLLRLQCADLDVVKGRHEVGSDLGHFPLCRRRLNVRLIGFKDILKCASCRAAPR